MKSYFKSSMLYSPYLYGVLNETASILSDVRRKLAFLFNIYQLRYPFNLWVGGGGGGGGPNLDLISDCN